MLNMTHSLLLLSLEGPGAAADEDTNVLEPEFSGDLSAISIKSIREPAEAFY